MIALTNNSIKRLFHDLIEFQTVYIRLSDTNHEREKKIGTAWLDLLNQMFVLQIFIHFVRLSIGII